LIYKGKVIKKRLDKPLYFRQYGLAFSERRKQMKEVKRSSLDILDSIAQGARILVRSRDLLKNMGISFEPAWEEGEENDLFDELFEIDNLIWEFIVNAHARKGEIWNRIQADVEEVSNS